jgi:hypothetical protein
MCNYLISKNSLIVSFGKILLSPREQGLFDLEVSDDKKQGESFRNGCGYFPDEINGFGGNYGK